MTQLECGAEILKVDEAGRVQMPPEKRAEVVGAFERSGMTGKAFARYSGIKYSTLMYWAGQRRKVAESEGGTGQRGSEQRWVEAVVEPGRLEKSNPLIVHLPGGARVEVADSHGVALAAELLRALAGVQAC